MIEKAAIDNALNAHAQWRHRLYNSIESGSAEFSIRRVGADDECEFGKWLLGIDSEDRCGSDYDNIKALHTEFHRIAARVLELALSGKREEALAFMLPGGEYNQASMKLIEALAKCRERSS